MKKGYKKKLVKDIKIFLKKKKEKSNNMVVNLQNISEDEKKKLLEYRKKNYIMKILLLYKGNYKKHFSFALMFGKFSLNKQKKKSEIVLF